jgi:nucleoid-associated protein YgaU
MENGGVLDMVTATESKPEQLDLEVISEYVRELKPRLNELSASANNFTETEILGDKKQFSFPTFPDESPPADVLETLWPGLHHQDFSHTIKKRAPGFYLVIGFLAGAVIVGLFTWCFTLLSSFFTHNNAAGMAQGKTENSESITSSTDKAVLVPLVATYEVQEGDTLAGIALRNYKHISPRLLDAICRANNLTDANVLNLGQKITLPEYTPQQ